jgi:hypothetical protein
MAFIWPQSMTMHFVYQRDFGASILLILQNSIEIQVRIRDDDLWSHLDFGARRTDEMDLAAPIACNSAPNPR